MDRIKDEFLTFAESLASNNCSLETWNKYAVRHYQEIDLENARIKLVRICIEDVSIGNKFSPLSKDAIIAINTVILDLKGGAER